MFPIEQEFLGAIGYLDDSGRAVVTKALAQVKTWHEGQLRYSGEPFVVHPIATALLLARLQCDAPTLSAGLLHDVVEDHCASIDDVEHLFGSEVRRLVDAVTKLTKLHYEGRRTERQLASLRKMLLAASDDLRVIVIKLADRLHNVETIHALRPDKQERVARETLEIYVPFARMVGLWDAKRRFEEVCFSIAFPAEAEHWHAILAERRAELAPAREEYCHRLPAITILPVSVRITERTDYELFRKCDGSPARLQESSIVDSVLVVPVSPSAEPSVCYQLLGDIHRHYHVRMESFRDFIGQPLANGYRALHTVVFLAHNSQVLTRIQTRDMESEAGERTYASWMMDRENPLSRVLASVHRRATAPDTYFEDLQENVLKERIDVFTPAGEIVALPRGASGIDLAAALDTSFLPQLSAMRVNGVQREVTGELHDGDTVELLFSTGEGNGREALWRQRAKTAEAKEDLRQMVHGIPVEQLKSEGRELLALECDKHLLPFRWLIRLRVLQRHLAQSCGQEGFSLLLGRIGGGELAVSRVAQAYRQTLEDPPTVFVKFLRSFHIIPLASPLAAGDTVTVDVMLDDRPGVLHAITRCFAERGVNILGTNTYEVSPGIVCDRLGVAVKDVQEFSDLYDALLQVPGVRGIRRIR